MSRCVLKSSAGGPGRVSGAHVYSCEPNPQIRFLRNTNRPSQPCQSLFVAPCSHVWHYKCIRPILNDHRTFSQFLCPNCRAVTDLNGDIDDALDRWEDVEDMPDIASEDPSEVVSQEQAHRHVMHPHTPRGPLRIPRLRHGRTGRNEAELAKAWCTTE